MTVLMKKMHEVTLSVSIIKEGKAFVAYSPALDISTAGSSLKEVKMNFAEAVDIFFEEVRKRGTTEDALYSLGWEKVTKNKKVDWTPPIEVEHSTTKVSVPA